MISSTITQCYPNDSYNLDMQPLTRARLHLLILAPEISQMYPMAILKEWMAAQLKIQLFFSGKEEHKARRFFIKIFSTEHPLRISAKVFPNKK